MRRNRYGALESALAVMLGLSLGAASAVCAADAQSGTPAEAPAQSPRPAPADAAAPSSVEIAVLGYSATREGGQADGRQRAGDSVEETRRAETAGRLIHTQLRAHLQQATVAEVLRAFGQTVGVPLLPLYRQRAGDPGLDPRERIDLNIEAASAYEVLDAVASAAMGPGGGWQVYNGRVEVGPKWILARDSAREVVTLSVRDLLLEPPTLQNFGPDVREALQERFPEAILSIGGGDRSTPDVLAAELVMEIERRVEPDAWLVDEAQRASLVRSGEIDNPLARAGQWASMTARDGSLVVTAPDFVLRGIRGYPGALPPQVERGGEPRASRAVPPEQPVVSALGGGRMELLGFLPASGRGQPGKESTSIPPEALAAAGRLVHARLDVTLEETTVADAVEMLSRTTGARIGPLWATETTQGLDPASRLTLEMRDASGREVLEIILALADASSECTWQLAGEGIEIGPKLLLARPEARRAVTLDVSELVHEAPYFIGPGKSRARDGLLGIATPLERNYGEELGMSRKMDPPVKESGEIRKSPKFIAAELLLLLEKHVEPKGWLSTDEQLARRAARGLRDFEPLQRDGAWIGVTYRNGSLVIAAPDFVLRGVVGYPHLLSPVGDRTGSMRDP